MKVAFVAPFYGAGRPAAPSRSAATRRCDSPRPASHVEVFTTCLLDLQHDWGVNVHREGTTVEDGLYGSPIPRRDARPAARSRDLNQRLLRGETLSADEERQFIALHINSFGLYRRLAEVSGEFDWFCFIPYLFGTTFHGTTICPGEIDPDPVPARRGLCADGRDALAVRPGGAHCLSHARRSRNWRERLYGDRGGQGRCSWARASTRNSNPTAARFAGEYGIRSPFVLYAGRKDATKNVDTF